MNGQNYFNMNPANQVNVIEDFDDDYDDLEYVDEIYEEDQQHADSEKENGRRYIGVYKYFPKPKIALMANSVSAQTFFRHSIRDVYNYLIYYSPIMLFNCSMTAKIEIMQLAILPDETYSVVLKTHWLRIIQRRWKKVYREKMATIRGRAAVSSRQYFEIHGRYPYGLNRMPGLGGMLSNLLIERHQV